MPLYTPEGSFSLKFSLSALVCLVPKIPMGPELSGSNSWGSTLRARYVPWTIKNRKRKRTLQMVGPYLGTTSIVLSLLHMLTVVNCEPLHHSRNFKDEYGLEPPRRVFGVKTFEQGLEYLVKYGWVNCTLSFTNIGRNSLSDMLLNRDPETRVREGFATRPLCSEEEAQKGYAAMQQYYKLPETGTLDDNTLRLMNSKRCGNRDSINDDKKDDDDSTTIKSTRVKRAALVEIERRKKQEEDRQNAARGSVLFGKMMKQIQTSVTNSVIRRKQMLNEFTSEFQKEEPITMKSSLSKVIMNAMRGKQSEYSDSTKMNSENKAKSRRKRSAMVTINNSEYEVFNQASDKCVTWRIPSICYSRRIPADDQRGIVKLAFRMWSEVIPLCFEEQRDGPISDVDIQICFAKDTHLNCQIPFDGSGGELAHSWKLGNIHFDDAENYKPNGNGGINLLKVAVHEIGHVLGLNHTQRNYSVMYSIYIRVPIQQDFELGWEDRKDVQRYYGVCGGTFDTVFDYIKPSPDRGLIYNTYFFRDSRYWMYENRWNRTRYGDPLAIVNEWKGLPTNIQACTQTILWNQMEKKWSIETYFFKGDEFYVYNIEDDVVEEGLKISDHFGPKDNTSEAVPDNVDSTLFEIRTKKLHFFKGIWVYIYNPVAGFNQCCDQKVKFADQYPTTEGKKLTGDIDAAYYSHTFNKLYFFKGEDTWVDQGGNGKPHSLRYQEKWYSSWYDICDPGQHRKLTLQDNDNQNKQKEKENT